MDGKDIVKAWRQWLESPKGKDCSAPDLPPADSARQYLENRLEEAFQAGIRAAERDVIYTANRKKEAA